jgi:hypothetical protein
MFRSLFARPMIARLTMTVLLAAQTLGWITFAQGNETTPPPPPVPVLPNSLSAKRRALREFDRFLDHHPLLEDQLRIDPDLITDKAFLEKTPGLLGFLKENRNVVDGLKLYPRYFLNRAFLRQASAPISFSSLAAFRDLFQQQPTLERALTANPELIRDPAFVKSNAALRDFFAAHPGLAKVFLPSSVPPHP